MYVLCAVCMCACVVPAEEGEGGEEKEEEGVGGGEGEEGEESRAVDTAKKTRETQGRNCEWKNTSVCGC